MIDCPILQPPADVLQNEDGTWPPCKKIKFASTPNDHDRKGLRQTKACSSSIPYLRTYFLAIDIEMHHAPHLQVLRVAT